MKPNLGQLKKIDVRTLWPNEAADFTPWLAEPAHLTELGEALGLELELENIEVAVGPYSADILARDSTGSYVVIENQLGKTDHDHLGKAITYASVLAASTVIWMAPQFTDEHRKALEWLNDNTSEDLGFYAVQLEAWSIDGSKPAVRFDVLSRPVEIIRQASMAKTGELTEVRKLQLEWWTAFRDTLVARKLLLSPRAPRPQYWYDVPIGRAGFVLSNTANTYDNLIGVRLYISNRHGALLALNQLMESKTQIEKEIGFSLSWNPNADAVDKVIAAYREADLTLREHWPEYLKWMADTTERFRTVFGPRVKGLQLTENPGASAEQGAQA